MRDFLDAELPLADPEPAETYVNMKWQEPMYFEGGDPFDYSSGLTVDGLAVSAAQLNHDLSTGKVGASISVNGKQVVFIDYSHRSFVDHNTVSSLTAHGTVARIVTAAIILTLAHTSFYRNHSLETEQVSVQVASLRANHNSFVRPLILSLPTVLSRY